MQSPKDSPAARRPTNVRWLVLALACATSWLLYFQRYSWGVIKADVKQEFQLTDGQLGWLDSAFGITYAVFQIPTGLAGDIWGPALVLPLIIIAWSGMVGTTVLGNGFWSFASIRFAFGATQAGAYPNLSKVTRSWFPLSTRTSMQGLIASLSGRMGGACSPLIISSLLMGVFGFGWRGSLICISVLGFALALAFVFLFRNRPADHPWTNEAERRLIEDEQPPVDDEAEVVFSRLPWVRVSFAFLLLHIFTSAFADQLYVYWIPFFLREAKGLDKVELGFFASLPLFGGAIGGTVGGFLNDLLMRVTGKPRLGRSIVGFTGKLLAAGLVALALSIDDGRSMMVVIAMAKFFTDWSQPTVWGTVTDIGGRASGRVFGIVNTFGSIGAFAANPILGYTKQFFGKVSIMDGWNAVFWIICGAYVASALCWLIIDATKRLVVEGDGSTRVGNA